MDSNQSYQAKKYPHYYSPQAISATLENIDSHLLCTQLPEASFTKFGIAQPLAFLNKNLNTIQFAVRAKSPLKFRVEAHGFVTKFNKAFIEFDSAGNLTLMGEEIHRAKFTTDENGYLLIEMSFIPCQSRLEHLFVFAESNEDVSLGEENLQFDFELLRLTHEPESLNLNLEPVIQKKLKDVVFAINDFWIFRNYLHINFDLFKKGKKLSKLFLFSKVEFECIQWWTSDSIEPSPKAEITPTNAIELKPQLPDFPLASPIKMETEGISASQCGHSIVGIFKNLTDLRYSSIENDFEFTSSLKLHAVFSDGDTVDLPLHSTDLFFNPLQTEFNWIKDYCLSLSPKKQPIFLEVGARGPRSQDVRNIVSKYSKYLGTDIGKDNNVDIICDAHKLSSEIDINSIDIVYTDTVMEHLISPAKFIQEANKILCVGGLFIATVPTTWPLHAEPWDYWRFSSHAWASLLNSLSGFEILNVREHGRASILPSLTIEMASPRMQYDPAPLFTSVIAKKISDCNDSNVFWSENLASGRYDP